jgi:hypothetical protein
MDSKVCDYNYFYALCNRWREEYPSKDPKFEDFLNLLEIQESDFAREIHENRFLDEMRHILLARIADLNNKFDWVSLIELWDEFRLGNKIGDWCALAIESTIQEGRPSLAARIVASHQLNPELTKLALIEYARDCEKRGSVSEFQLFCTNHGILPNGPSHLF